MAVRKPQHHGEIKSKPTLEVHLVLLVAQPKIANLFLSPFQSTLTISGNFANSESN
ncbi:hypothetical protein GBA52_008080 [Prunus armeniaca]|nr:hypothetical protein GBA52_008080 [Prunus armeniaca]